MDRSGEATQLLHALGSQDSTAAERLFALVYDELRAVAHKYFKHQRLDHTLQPTALVNEAFLKLIDQSNLEWQNRAHFLAVAAKAMRQILIDHARERQALKRGGEFCRVTMAEGQTPVTEPDPEILDLEECLQRLAAIDPRQSRVVELRFFGGLTVEEVAHVLGVSKATVEAEWRMARAWIRRELSNGTRT